MGTNEAALIQLCREKRGEAQPEDLSDVLMVQLGTVTEDLNRRWYERNTGNAVTRELAPVLAGLMVAGRIGASMAAEIGTMRVTEQIDALTTLATNPIKYLVVPRLIAAVVSMPILVGIADSIGVFGGYIVSTQSLGFSGGTYLKNTVDFVTHQDVTSGLIKAAVFGFIIALLGCYNGFHSKGGAQGVGTATTNAVVSSSILILAANYVLTSVLFSK